MKYVFRTLRSTVTAIILFSVHLMLPSVSVGESLRDHADRSPSSSCIKINFPVNPAVGKVAHDQVLVRGGEFIMGHDNAYPEERPARKVTVGDFYIDTHEVTNAQFQVFVDATGYITSAERQPDPAFYPGIPVDKLVPGSASFIKLEDRPVGQMRDWWKFIKGASWRQPSGPGSNIDGMDSFPVVHVSYRDASAYAEWVGRELPSEAEWEFAAQASAQLVGANTWQGFFPLQDKALDGHSGIAPVGCYRADETGLFDMKGNVWELVADIFETHEKNAIIPLRVIKGGSFLCADVHCQRNRPQARQWQEENFSTDHVGFRTISSLVSGAATK